jgi:ABC-type sugar transport system ATPase subunit
VLDEPTSSLSREEVRRLFEIIRGLRNRGMAIVYISHHLPEVFEIADRVTVLRDGMKIATCDIHEVTPQSLVRMMVGGHVDEYALRREASVGDPVLHVEHLTRAGFFHDVTFTLRAGEILGLAGLSGAGRTELARSLCGLDPVHFGSARLADVPLARNDYPANVARGITYLTEDRKRDGLFLRLPVTTNLLAAMPAVRGTAPGASLVERRLRELAIAAASPEVDAGTLSGGNQQKVLLGKCLNAEPRVLILDEPTRGVDVNAKRGIHEAVVRLVETGAAVLLISSDLPELAGLSDRVLVLRKGRLIGELPREVLNEENLLLAANGQLEACHGVA